MWVPGSTVPVVVFHLVDGQSGCVSGGEVAVAPLPIPCEGSFPQFNE